MAKRKPDYELVARRQRWLLFLVLGLLFTLIGMIASPFIAGRAVASITQVGFTVLYWGCVLAGLVAMILLMIAQAKHPVTIVLLSLLMFIPIVNLLVLVHVNSEATIALKAQEIKVGFLGASKSEWIKLRRGHCRGCGYDRSGIELLGPCPECGRVPEIR
jgi:hypothetical protein